MNSEQNTVFNYLMSLSNSFLTGSGDGWVLTSAEMGSLQ